MERHLHLKSAYQHAGTILTIPQTTPAIVSGLGIHGAFLLFSSCCLANLVTVYFIMPETRGLSLEDIEDLYRVKKGEKK